MYYMHVKSVFHQSWRNSTYLLVKSVVKNSSLFRLVFLELSVAVLVLQEIHQRACIYSNQQVFHTISTLKG